MAQTQEFRGTARSIITRDGVREYVYHSTAVVVVNADKSIRLDSGGWLTATTKRAMNQASVQDALGFRVFQKRGDWFVDWRGETFDFKDQMVLDDTRRGV